MKQVKETLVRVDLAYGKEGLTVELPDKNVVKVLAMKEVPAVGDPTKLLKEKLARPTGSFPLSELARGRKTAAIAVSDITRPVPNTVLLPPILSVLEESGIERDDITIIIATGNHRPAPDEEIIELLGDEVARKYRVVNHHSRRLDEHTFLGHTPLYKTPIYVDTRFLDADLKILTGLIEPHFMAGYSGGRKLVTPGLAAFETVKVLHGPEIMDHQKAVEGVIEGNPLHEEILYIARRVGVDFIANVTMDEKQIITGIFCGDLEKAFVEGIKLAGEQTTDTISSPVDCVITTSAGYPLDLTYYQAVKGISTAAPIVKKGGIIIIAARCAEGIGGPEFTDLVIGTESLDDFMRVIHEPDFYVLDQWELQKFCHARRKAEVWIFSEGIEKETFKRLFVHPISSIEEGVRDVLARCGEDATIAVIPKGPYVIARLSDDVN